MRLSTSTNIYFNRPDGTKAPIVDSVRRCAAAGYQVMDMNFHDCTTFRTPFVGDQYRQWLEEIQTCAQKEGIEFSQAHAPFYNFCDPTYENRDYMDERIRRAVLCAKELRVPWIVIHAGTAFGEAQWHKVSLERNVQYFLPLVEFAAKVGVGIAIENLWELNIAPLRRYTAEPDEVMELVERLDSTQVGICCDVEHTEISKQDTAAALRLFGSRLKATHISDVINVDSDHLLPFFGRTDWVPVMRALREIGYAGDFTYEIHRYTSRMPDEVVQGALEYSVSVGNYLLSLR